MNDINVDLFGEQESLFSDEVLDELSLIIKKYPDDDIIEDAFNYFRKTGFPYPDLTLFEMKQEINRLANTVKESCLRSTVAYKVADSFHKHRFHSSAIGMRNPLQSYNIDKSLRKAIKMELKGSGIKRNQIAFLNMVNGTQACANFRPAYAKMMYDEHARKDAIVFDSSTGYGGRLVGFLGSDCHTYIGVDPNTLTHEANQKLFETLRCEGKECTLINEPAEDVNVDEHDIRSVADFCFTSPPYFKKEIYSDEETQSCNRYEDYEVWIKNFLYPMMQLNCDVAIGGGIVAINIEDVKIKGTLYSLVKPTIDAGIKAGLTFMKKEEFGLQSRTILKDGQKFVSEAFESVLFFEKIESEWEIPF